jgi:hypothetical protein
VWDGEKVKNRTTSSTGSHNVLADSIIMLLLGTHQEVAKKGAKGLNALWIPVTRHEKLKFF